MEAQAGNDFYDSKGVFESYMQHRAWEENPVEVIEKPLILDLLNDKLKGAVLDVGCGYGDLAKELVRRGVSRYTGIDASRKMIALAKSQLSDPRTEFIQADITQWQYAPTAYDQVLARLVFHYIADLAALLDKLRDCLAKEGKLICSVEHPLLTSSMEIYRPVGKKGPWLVDQYFELGPRTQEWMGGKVVKYHRSIEEYWRLFTEAGFRIESLQEGYPQFKFFKMREEYERRKRIPLFLIIKAVKDINKSV
ncbi:class I SAM-dependent methyltransferase [Rhodocytophaga aerolata]|uniref:Class I SAM-dependent methyltransferase n=1 Tax=Rhodocytophaga aerolata TaxID=455078 RepID=A0ABT8RIV0_9BACT|nr:class I SAM-dependent methyltransferase [Rhodocytophaga aerolata]MDO1451088.1 class I SAM-dependent methyltransferase [Rhodocytophaga aerolata]